MESEKNIADASSFSFKPEMIEMDEQRKLEIFKQDIKCPQQAVLADGETHPSALEFMLAGEKHWWANSKKQESLADKRAKINKGR